MPASSSVMTGCSLKAAARSTALVAPANTLLLLLLLLRGYGAGAAGEQEGSLSRVQPLPASPRRALCRTGPALCHLLPWQQVTSARSQPLETGSDDRARDKAQVHEAAKAVRAPERLRNRLHVGRSPRLFPGCNRRLSPGAICGSWVQWVPRGCQRCGAGAAPSEHHRAGVGLLWLRALSRGTCLIGQV